MFIALRFSGLFISTCMTYSFNFVTANVSNLYEVSDDILRSSTVLD